MRNPIFAFIFERLAARNEQRGQAQLREELLAGLTGRVLELGPGTGLNFEHYPSTVDVVIAVEPEVTLRQKAAVAALEATVRVLVVSGIAERIPTVDAAFDAVVVSGVLCSVCDVNEALAEVRRILRPGGELRFYEHVRSDKAGRGRFQDVVNLVWPRFMGGCHPNRRSLAAIEGAGYRVARCRAFTFPPTARISPVAPRILGVARLQAEVSRES